MTAELHYTTLYHQARKALGLTVIEYCIADMVYHLCNNPSQESNGWCFSSRQYFAEELGVGEATIYRAITKLIKLGILTKHSSTSMLKCTPLWYETVIIKKSNKDYQNDSSAIKVTDHVYQNDSRESIKMIDNNNIDINNKEKEISKEKENKYPTLTDLQENDFEYIALRYKVPLAFVKSKFEDMQLWAASRPQNGKLKGRNWRMTLMTWVKRDGIKIMERRGYAQTRFAVDARGA